MSTKKKVNNNKLLRKHVLNEGTKAIKRHYGTQSLLGKLNFRTGKLGGLVCITHTRYYKR